MTEQDERIIYEWVGYADIEARVETIHEPNPLIPDYETTHWYRNGYRCEPPPALDMNFAFDVCIPRLVREGVKVMYNNMGSGEWWMDVSTPESATDIFHEDADFYSALLAYIKGVK
jgi:hypothetical protein